MEEVGGTWGAAQAVPGLSALGPGGVGQVACSAPGDCAAAGGYTGAGGPEDQQAFVVDETNGGWDTAQEVPGLSQLNVGEDALLNSISCASAGECLAGGTFLRSLGGNNFGGFLVEESHGSWGPAHKVPGLRPQDPSSVTSVSCGAVGGCGAIGDCECASTQGHNFVINQVAGRWGTADVVIGLDDSGIGLISCPSANHCTAAGEMGEDGRVLSEPGRPPRCSPTTGLAASVASRQALDGQIDFKIVYTNRGASGCDLAGIPGAMGYLATKGVAVGPPARRTASMGAGATIYLGQLGGKAQTIFVARTGNVLKTTACRPKSIDEIVVRAIGVPQFFVPLSSHPLVCQGIRSEAIYGFSTV